jgi:purine-nucleoside phosphorylase
MAAGVISLGQQTAETIHHEDVMEIGRRVERQFTSLLTALVPQIAQAGRP